MLKSELIKCEIYLNDRLSCCQYHCSYQNSLKVKFYPTYFGVHLVVHYHAHNISPKRIIEMREREVRLVQNALLKCILTLPRI